VIALMTVQVRRADRAGVRRAAVCQPGAVLAKPEGVLKTGPVQVARGAQARVRHAGASPPQPQRAGDRAAAGQAPRGDPGQLAPDDRRLARALEAAAAGEPRGAGRPGT
jgi:hypothetical protein